MMNRPPYLPRFLCLGFMLLGLCPAASQETPLQAMDRALDEFGRQLTFGPEDRSWELIISGRLVGEVYAFNESPIGIFAYRDEDTQAARARLTLDGDLFIGDRLYAFGRLRWDDGIDPGADSDQVRFDELFIRYAVVPQHLQLQAGRFTNLFGKWQARGNALESAFITAPLAYENFTSVSDSIISHPQDLAQRVDVPDIFELWVPIIWGQVYSEGVAILGTSGKVDYAFSLTNVALSSHTFSWDDTDFAEPVWTGRMGWRPDLAWEFGLSGSWGPYLVDRDLPFPDETGREDFPQRTAGIDVSWAGGDWQVFGEAIWNRFEVPNVGDADAFSWFVEARRDFGPQIFGAARFSHQVFFDLETPSGDLRWDTDKIKVDLAGGWSPIRHLQLKLQYTYTHDFDGPIEDQHLGALQTILWW